MVLESILGVAFGGVTRLAQEGLSIWDKRDERKHERSMFEAQVKLQETKAVAEADLRRMDLEAERERGHVDLLTTALRDQASQVRAAGGWVASLSASVRPVVTYILLAMYVVVKVAVLQRMLAQEVPFLEAAARSFTEFDATIFGATMTYWFADRSIGKSRRAI